MKATYRLIDTDDIYATMTITLRLKHWTKVMDLLDKEEYDIDQFAWKIRHMVSEANKSYIETTED